MNKNRKWLDLFIPLSFVLLISIIILTPGVLSCYYERNDLKQQIRDCPRCVYESLPARAVASFVAECQTCKGTGWQDVSHTMYDPNYYCAWCDRPIYHNRKMYDNKPMHPKCWLKAHDKKYPVLEMGELIWEGKI